RRSQNRPESHPVCARIHCAFRRNVPDCTGMLALQAVTPRALAERLPAITLAEARKAVAQVHRGEPVHPTSALRRVAADAIRAAGHVPELTVVAEAAS